ncbi:cytochrome P450 2F3, partial [Trichonephila inaurata madagascariensis]
MVFQIILKNSYFEDFLRLACVIVLTYGICVFLSKVIKWFEVRKKGPPGPIGLPLVGYLPFLGKESHKTFWNLRKKYGNIVSVYLGQKYMVVLNDYNTAKEVLCHSAALDRSPDIFSHLGDIGFIAENGESWVEQRRYCLSATRDLGLGRGHWEDLIM